jgi:acetyl esterase/lipase
MILDPEVVAFLAAHPPALGPEATPAQRRAAIQVVSDNFFTAFSAPAVDVASVEDVAVPVAGGQLRGRVYRPARSGGLPVHLYFHGGGWWLGSVDELVVDATCRARSVGANCVVVALEYRLAPEHRFPTAVEDCYSALVWAAGHAVEFGGDGTNISVGGTSAGANLAAAVALATRDRGGPALRLQLLEVPPLDLTLSHVAHSQVADDYGITRADLQENAEIYLSDPNQSADPLASPLLAADLTRLARAAIMTAELDPLCVDGEAYAQRLRAAGVPVDYHEYPGATHGSLLLTGTWAPAQEWQDDVVGHLRRAHWAEAVEQDGDSVAAGLTRPAAQRD